MKRRHPSPIFLWRCRVATLGVSEYDQLMSAAPKLDDTMPAFVSTEEARLLMAVKLFETHRVTLGQAAQMVGYSKSGFIDVLGSLGVSVVDYPAEELAAEAAW